jgi:hypothetical protein
MPRLPARFAAVILCFAPLLQQRSWRHAEVLLVGASRWRSEHCSMGANFRAGARDWPVMANGDAACIPPATRRAMV